jgi:origin recognition complex subunit 5
VKPLEPIFRLHSAYIAVAYDSFAGEIRDLEEIRLLACCVWYPFVEPLLQGAVPVTRVNALLSRSSYLFRDAISRLYTREIGPSEWISQMVDHAKIEWQEAGTGQQATVKRPRTINKPTTLPFIPSFLLLASFLASYNPARLDVRYFVRDESALLPEGHDQRANGRSKSRKRKQRVVRRGGGGGGSRNRQEMLGPKMFALDRLLSIFQALMTEAGPQVQVWMGEEESQVKSDLWEAKSRSVAIMESINTLVRMNLLVRTGAAEKLEGTSLMRTNVTFDAIGQVSERVKFDLAEWLWDWNQ